MKNHKIKSIQSSEHITLTDIKDFLPIGSIVRLSVDNKKYMIYGIVQSEPTKYGQCFDYAAVQYPDGGFADNATTLFNHTEIADVIYRGYVDDEISAFPL